MKTKQISALARLSLLDLYRRKDLVVVFILCAVLIAPLAFFAPFGIPGASRQMSELSLLLIWVFSLIISIGVSTRLIPPELENRTIYPLLAKPVSRGTVLIGKYTGALAASLSALLLFYLAFALLSGFREHAWFPPVLIQAFILHAAAVTLLCAVAMLGSLVLTPSANWTVTVIVAFSMIAFGGRIPHFAASQPAPTRQILALIDLLAPHFDFFDMRMRVIHQWSGISWRLCGFIFLYSLIYSSVCLGLAALIFKRKRI